MMGLRGGGAQKGTTRVGSVQRSVRLAIIALNTDK